MHGQGAQGLRWINFGDLKVVIVTMTVIAISHAKYLVGYVQLTHQLNKSLDLKT
jgi:hypothetical protein